MSAAMFMEKRGKCGEENVPASAVAAIIARLRVLRCKSPLSSAGGCDPLAGCRSHRQMGPERSPRSRRGRSTVSFPKRSCFARSCSKLEIVIHPSGRLARGEDTKWTKSR
jgi:hypothetical protein